MIRIYVRRKNEIAGHVFICKSSIKEDKVAILPFIGFVTAGLITEEEWALLVRKSQAKASAETFCTSHGIPVEVIEETETSYRICIEFNYK